jgi:hypothetical protein
LLHEKEKRNIGMISTHFPGLSKLLFPYTCTFSNEHDVEYRELIALIASNMNIPILIKRRA